MAPPAFIHWIDDSVNSVNKNSKNKSINTACSINSTTSTKSTKTQLQTHRSGGNSRSPTRSTRPARRRQASCSGRKQPCSLHRRSRRQALLPGWLVRPNNQANLHCNLSCRNCTLCCALHYRPTRPIDKATDQSIDRAIRRQRPQHGPCVTIGKQNRAGACACGGIRLQVLGARGLQASDHDGDGGRPRCSAAAAGWRDWRYERRSSSVNTYSALSLNVDVLRDRFFQIHRQYRPSLCR